MHVEVTVPSTRRSVKENTMRMHLLILAFDDRSDRKTLDFYKLRIISPAI